MNLETYLSRASELGIDRGHLATTFPVHEDLITVDKRTIIHGYTVISPRRQPPPPDLVLEDLSHLNPPARGKRTGRTRQRVYTPEPKDPDKCPRPGEITLKEWIHAEALRRGMTVNQISGQYHRGAYRGLTTRRVNKRLVFVSVTNDQTQARRENDKNV